MADILYLDNHLLVMSKPAGMLSQADETGDQDLLSLGKQFLKERFQKPGAVYLGLVHRLDRPASGIMVMARTSKAAGRLSQQFREHRPKKKYLAIVEGTPPLQATLEDYLAKQDRVSQVVKPNHPKGKFARLSYQRLASFQGFSLVSVQLETGRAHQIRLQFSSRGHALLGDFRYGSQTPFDGKNLALHAYELDFEHPVGKKPMSFQLQPPLTWRGHFKAPIQSLNLPLPPSAASW